MFTESVLITVGDNDVEDIMNNELQTFQCNLCYLKYHC